jgi:glycine cleavage system H protein
MSQDRLYTKTHEWIQIEKQASGARIGTVGLTAFAYEALTDLVFVDLPAVGRAVHAGQPFGEIESVKAVSDLCSPVDGTVVEVNPAIAKNLAHLADDPYGVHWFIKVQLADAAVLDGLLDEAAYQKQCEEEQH